MRIKNLFCIAFLAILSGACTDLDVPEVNEASIGERLSTRIPESEAVMFAQKAISEVSTSATRGVNDYQVESIEHKKDIEGDTLLYVINFEEGGYAVVSADSRAGNVLAYSSTGKFDDVDEFIHNYILETAADYVEQQISRSNRPTIPPIIPEPRDTISILLVEDTPWGRCHVWYSGWNTTRAAFNLLTTAWDQGEPYNFFCYDSNGRRAMAGCAPIAVSQIAAYYRHPATFSGHIYDWDEIATYPRLFPGELHGPLLIYDIATALGTTFGVEKSPTRNSNVPGVLTSLGYAHSGLIDYNEYQIKLSLDLNCPVYMSGDDANGGDGHAWVLDGYRQLTETRKYFDYYTHELVYTGQYSRRFFHHNWGAGPLSSECWLDANVFTFRGSNYCLDVEMIAYICPLN